jgi:hypothetical protein
MVKKIFKPIIFDIFSKKEQIAKARTNSHGQAQIATACGGPLPPPASHFLLCRLISHTDLLHPVLLTFTPLTYPAQEACFLLFSVFPASSVLTKENL